MADVLGNLDLYAMSAAIDRATANADKPTMIKVTTTIGYGSLLEGSAATHGSPLKADDIKQFKEKFSIAPEPFTVSEK